MPQITTAQPRLAFLAPKFNLLVLRLVVWLLPYWLKYKLHILKIDVTDIDRLVEVYKQAQTGSLRLIIAFRHPSRDDAFCLGYLLTKILPIAARRHRIVFRSPIFAHFIYDRSLPLWAGKFVAWLYPRLGGIPIQRGRTDRVAIETARELLLNGEMPIAIAPEGASNGQSESVSPLESIAAQIGFGGMADLVRLRREEDVAIVPIGIQYYYLHEPWGKLESLICELETACGLVVDRYDSLVAIGQSDGRPMRKLLYDRFYHLSQHLLYQVENFYAQFYQYQIIERPSLEQPLSRTEISQRLQQLLDFALQVSESYFNLPPQGTKTDRVRNIERAGWDWIYRDELTSPENLSPVSRKLADRIATEADLRRWHMRIVESFIAVTSSYVKDRPTIDRFAEIALLLWDIIAQIQDRQSAQRPILGDRRVQLTIGNPIPLSDYWDRYKSGRRQARQATIDLTQELQTAMEGSIDRG
jgi:1-acyl-sn-glycerol-3-phosphate acyltransferase